jgi:hypothetical protein
VSEPIEVELDGVGGSKQQLWRDVLFLFRLQVGVTDCLVWNSTLSRNLMWAAISHTGKTALVHIPGNLTAQRYCDEILQPHVLPLMQQNGARFQHDNARPYSGCLWRTRLSKASQRCSIGLRSGDLDDQGSTATLELVSNAVVCVTRWMEQHPATSDSNSDFVNGPALSDCYWFPWWTYEILNCSDLNTVIVTAGTFEP